MFFITEFWGARSSSLTCHKQGSELSKENFPGKTFRGKLSRKIFPGKSSQGNLSREIFRGERESGRRTNRKRSLAKQDATRIATPGLHEVRSRSLTAWNGRNPAGSSGHFWHEWYCNGTWARRNGRTCEKTSLMSPPGAPLVELTRGWLTGIVSRNRARLAQTKTCSSGGGGLSTPVGLGYDPGPSSMGLVGSCSIRRLHFWLQPWPCLLWSV